MPEWTRDMVEERITEAAAVLRRLPPVRVAGYFGTWPEIQRTAKELAEAAPTQDAAAAAEHRGDLAGWRRRSPGTASSSATMPT